MMNLAHVLGWIILIIGFIMALGVGRANGEQRNGAFTMALICVVIGEVLTRL